MALKKEMKIKTKQKIVNAPFSSLLTWSNQFPTVASSCWVVFPVEWNTDAWRARFATQMGTGEFLSWAGISFCAKTKMKKKLALETALQVSLPSAFGVLGETAGQEECQHMYSRCVLGEKKDCMSKLHEFPRWYPKSVVQSSLEERKFCCIYKCGNCSCLWIPRGYY